MYYGLKIGLTRDEVMNIRIGELRDLITCYQIDVMGYQPVNQYTYEEIYNMR